MALEIVEREGGRGRCPPWERCLQNFEKKTAKKTKNSESANLIFRKKNLALIKEQKFSLRFKKFRSIRGGQLTRFKMFRLLPFERSARSGVLCVCRQGLTASHLVAEVTTFKGQVAEWGRGNALPAGAPPVCVAALGVSCEGERQGFTYMALRKPSRASVSLLKTIY